MAVSGLFTAISGTVSAGLTSQLGSVKMVGKTGAEVSSNEKVFVAGKKDVQVNSTEGQLFLHGATGFYLGTGAGPPTPLGPFGPIVHGMAPVAGWGIVGDASTGLKIGKLTDAKTFGSASQPDATMQIAIDAQGVRITSNSSTLVFDSSGATINGSRIQLGS
jgi:hypothetical protein